MEWRVNICLTLTEINWALTKDVFSIIGTIGALIFAGFGLSTWKRQLKGTSEYGDIRNLHFLVADKSAASL